MLSDKKICFVGAGAMAEAVLRGMLNHHIVKPGQITVTNREDRFRLNELTYNFGVVGDPTQKYEAIQQADILILAMKPKDVREALQEIRIHTSETQLILSVIAGVSTTLISETLQTRAPVIRTMPNTSAIVGFSSTGICAGAYAEKEDMEVAKLIFESVGRIFITDEEYLDAMTGLSGSGPAYIYYMVEAMIKAGVDVGLTEEVAKEMTLQILRGAAQMLEETNADPAYLREQITSPNGTTQKGIETLQTYHFEEAVRKSIYRATERSKELGELFQNH